MSGRLFIRTRRSEHVPPIDGKWPRIQALTDIHDVEVIAVDPDTGAEVQLAVDRVSVLAELNRPIVATINVIDVDLDVEAIREPPTRDAALEEVLNEWEQRLTEAPSGHPGAERDRRRINELRALVGLAKEAT